MGTVGRDGSMDEDIPGRDSFGKGAGAGRQGMF